MSDTLLINTTYGERKNVVVKLSRSAMQESGMPYFAATVGERHEENGDKLEFFVRVPNAKIVAEVKIDDAGDLKNLQ